MNATETIQKLKALAPAFLCGEQVTDERKAELNACVVACFQAPEVCLPVLFDEIIRPLEVHPAKKLKASHVNEALMRGIPTLDFKTNLGDLFQGFMSRTYRILPNGVLMGMEAATAINFLKITSYPKNVTDFVTEEIRRKKRADGKNINTCTDYYGFRPSEYEQTKDAGDLNQGLVNLFSYLEFLQRLPKGPNLHSIYKPDAKIAYARGYNSARKVYEDFAFRDTTVFGRIHTAIETFLIFDAKIGRFIYALRDQEIRKPGTLMQTELPTPIITKVMEELTANILGRS